MVIKKPDRPLQSKDVVCDLLLFSAIIKMDQSQSSGYSGLHSVGKKTKTFYRGYFGRFISVCHVSVLGICRLKYNINILMYKCLKYENINAF